MRLSPNIDIELDRQVINLTFFQRLKYSLKGVGFYFLIALGTVLIPILHFILVPLFLAVSIGSGYSRFQKTRSIDLTNVLCPNCSEDLNASVTYFNTNEISLVCYKCQSQFTLA